MLYSYKCRKCKQEFDDIRAVEDRHNCRCSCGGKAILQITCPRLVRSDPKNWSDENGGRGRYISQLQKTLGSKVDPNAYCRSQRDAINKAFARGDRAEIIG